MAWLMTAPSRVMRSPSHAGTRPPWSGKSALPDRRVIPGSVRLEAKAEATHITAASPRRAGTIAPAHCCHALLDIKEPVMAEPFRTSYPRAVGTPDTITEAV